MRIEKLLHLRKFLLATSIFGFACINLPFLYISIFEKEIYHAALANPLAMVFIIEAFMLMFFFAFLIARMKWHNPGWLFFIVMSVLGSMAFSVPFYLYCLAGRHGRLSGS